MATPFADPRTGQLYFRRAVPEALRAAFGGRLQVKVTLGTKDPAVAKVAFARENASFEEKLADARRQMAEGTLVPTPAALVRRWCEGPAGDTGLTGAQRLVMTFMELDAAAGGRMSASADDVFPPALLGPAANTDWSAVLADRERFEAILATSYEGDAERAGSNWIRLRWHDAPSRWRHCLDGPVARLRAFHDGAERFSNDELTSALLEIVDTHRSGDEDVNRARLAPRRPSTIRPRLRANLRLKQLFAEWKDGRDPRPQTAIEFEAAVDDFIDYAGDLPVAMIDADLLYDYRDEAAKLPATMPRADRLLPFRARVAKHGGAKPKCSPSTLKKRVGALQALLTYAADQRWIAANAGVRIKIEGYSKSNRKRRSFEDHELTTLFAAPLFTHHASWNSRSRISDVTIFWLFLLAATTGARLEEVGQVALADVKRDGRIIYLDIDRYSLEGDAEDEDDAFAAKSVKNEDSIRLIPVHAKLIELGFETYLDALRAAGHSQLFPDLKENKVGKRTKEASQRINRIIDRHVARDRRLVFYSLRHTFKAKGNDAGITDRTLDQICGHAPLTTGGRYGLAPRIRTLHRELHRIDYSCIDWSAMAAGMSSVDWTAMLKGGA
ncbi:site-specific integrase [Sphingomonas panacisoli]|uniref:Site-specific integrase n=1 Tax=Sphingomonas panacisoli TaxID=1813879 RepID=A0A5B8LID9_9SPHN|nr:site-specific integrase [Sphingomonas panacisoli]QDZ08077.1 site-specific integrase [Sphingomonas panacisoli]